MGVALVALFGRVGINLQNLMHSTSRFYVDPVVYTEINFDHLVITITAVVIAVLPAAVVPALRAARLEPVEAIHHV